MSLKGDKYENVEEVRFRLESTIVLYEGRPVYITRVQIPNPEQEKGEIARVFFRELPWREGDLNNKEVRKYLSSRNFDLAPFKMGYLNERGRAYFTSRTPLRQNRQGLCANTTVVTDVFGKKADIGFANFVRSQGFVDMVAGKYPSFKEVGELLGNGDTTSVAVSRMFAFVIDHDLEALFMMHKGVRCGMSMKGDKGLKVPPKFHFLREEMEENRIPIL